MEYKWCICQGMCVYVEREGDEKYMLFFVPYLMCCLVNVTSISNKFEVIKRRGNNTVKNTFWIFYYFYFFFYYETSWNSHKKKCELLPCLISIIFSIVVLPRTTPSVMLVAFRNLFFINNWSILEIYLV